MSLMLSETPRAAQCYAMVRGSAIRATGLDSKGRLIEPTPYVATKSVIGVRVNEVNDPARSEFLSTPEFEKRIRLHQSAQTIRFTVDIEFIRVDPELISLVAGAALVYKDVAGFGEVPFGIAPFGAAPGTVVGFDATSRMPAKSFALEVWSKLDAPSAKPRPLGFDQVPFDTIGFDTSVPNPDCEARQWGYTLFPYLRGGRLTGFRFENGLVSFKVIGAQTRKNPGWGFGPFDLSGRFERLLSPVSRNTSWRTMITTADPPEQTDGVQYLGLDVLDNGTAANPMPDPDALAVVDGGGADTSPWIIDGGRA